MRLISLEKLEAMTWKERRHSALYFWGPRVFWLFLTRCFGKGRRNRRVIVSMTSYADRFIHLFPVLLSLLVQLGRKDRLLLWLTGEDLRQLPKRILRLAACSGGRLVIREADRDLRSHKKYYYTFLEYPEDVVITVDDDWVYAPGLLGELWRWHEKYPEAVIAGRGRRICPAAGSETVSAERAENGTPVDISKAELGIAPYDEWQLCPYGSETPSMDLMPTGCGGVLYPPHCLFEQVTDIETARALAPDQDDLWLKVMGVLKGTPTLVLNSYMFYSSYELSYKRTLWRSNAEGEYNDINFRGLCRHFGLTARDF